MNASLDQRYFDWLYDQVCDTEPSYRNLLHILFTKEFVWLVPNDDNRLQDGLLLRREFLEDEGIALKPSDRLWMELGCSTLELLLVLARRLNFEAPISTVDAFWELLGNIGLDELSDDVDIPHDDVEDVLNQVIWRTYDRDGYGGLFPLNYPNYDQRKVELWYQLNAYVMERF